MNTDIQIDFEAVAEKIENALDFVRRLRCDKQYKTLFSVEYCNTLERKEKELKKYIEAPFNVMIVGDFKRGKTSFINALLGKSLLPSDIAPETVTVNTVSYGKENTVEIHLENDTKKTISIQELKRELLEPLVAKLPTKLKFISITDNNEILKSISFIDTPGLNDAVDSFDEIVVDYLANADAVIYVVSANFPMSLDEQNFLSNIIIPASLAKVIVIVNMCDCLDSETEIKEIKEFTKKKCNEINPAIEVFTISSLEELHRMESKQCVNQDTAEYLTKNFSYLSQELQFEVACKTESLKAINCINHTKSLLREINSKCISLKHSVSNQNADTITMLEEKRRFLESKKQEVEIIKKNASELIDTKLQEATLWMKQYLTRIKQELQNVCNCVPTDQIEKHIRFYFSDMIKKGFDACTNWHSNEISKKIQIDLKNLSLDGSTFTTSDIDDNIDLHEPLDTFAFSETLEMADILAANSLGIIKLIEGVFREKKKDSEKIKAKLSGQLLSSFNNIETKTQESIRFIYEQYKKTIIEKITQFSKEEKANLIDSFEQTRKIVTDTTRNNELLLNDINSLIAETEKHYKQMCFTC